MKTILFLTTAQVEHGRWSSEMRHDLIAGVINSLSPLLGDSVQMTIKLHPTENIDDYHAIPETSMVTVYRDISLNYALAISDLVLISGYSTCVLEAAISRKPVLLLNTFNEIEGFPFVGVGLAKGIYNLDDLLKAVEDLLYNQYSRITLLNKAAHFLASNKEFVDGKAAERICDLVMRLAHGGKK